MSDQPILPTVDDIIRPGVDSLRASRPNSAQYLNNDLAGNYGKVVHGVRAQAAVCLDRLTDGVVNARLTTASGAGLKTLVVTEYDSPQSFDPTNAIGTITLTRSVGTYPPGSIKKGSRFARSINNIASIPYAGATYETTVDTLVVQGQTTVQISIQAQRAGAASNHVQAVGFTPALTDLTISDALFDPNFTISALDAGGGSDSLDDPFLRQFATASSLGKFAPNNEAIAAGALKSLGVRHVLVKDDYVNGISTAFIADQAWGASPNWAASTLRYLTDNNVIGFGCRANVLPAFNHLIGVTATVTVRSTDYLAQTDDITLSIQTALRSYFDNRPDWDIFRAASIRGVIARADLRILTCTSVTVIDALTGAVLPDPSTTKPPFSQYQATHWYMINNGSTFTFQSPY